MASENNNKHPTQISLEEKPNDTKEEKQPISSQNFETPQKKKHTRQISQRSKSVIATAKGKKAKIVIPVTNSQKNKRQQNKTPQNKKVPLQTQIIPDPEG